MPGERLSMRKIREVLRLRFGHDLSQRAIARSLQLSAGAVNGYLSRARRAGIAWPVPDHLDDEQLERLLFPLPPDVPMDQRPVPDWAVVHRELRRPNMTLALLWEEYRTGAPDGFGYSCYVAAVLMLRLVARARDTVGNPGSIRNIEIAYKAFRNATNEGRERRSGRAFSPLRSTLARALAFIWRSTSA
jgi:hypothetical protein